MQSPKDPIILRHILVEYFDENDLRDLCFYLKVDYDSLPAVGKKDKARELIVYLERRNRVSELISLIQSERPMVEWKENSASEPVQTNFLVFVRTMNISSQFYTIALILLSIIWGGILQILCPDWVLSYITLSIVIIIIIFVASVTLLVHLRVLQPHILFVVFSFLLVSSLAITSIVVCKTALRRGTVYFIVDNSTNMQAVTSGISPILQLSASNVPDNLDIGMMTFGGGISGSLDCDDFIPLVPPTPRTEAISTLKERSNDLGSVRPQGRGGLQNAIIHALVDILAERNAVQQIFVITSQVDRTCGVPDPGAIELAAKRVGTKFSLSIITIGSVSPGDEAILRNLAHNGQYFNIPTQNEVPTVVPTIINPPVGVYGAPYNAPYR